MPLGDSSDAPGEFGPPRCPRTFPPATTRVVVDLGASRTAPSIPDLEFEPSSPGFPRPFPAAIAPIASCAAHHIDRLHLCPFEFSEFSRILSTAPRAVPTKPFRARQANILTSAQMNSDVKIPAVTAM